MDLDGIHCANIAMCKVSLPPNACFVLSKAVHMQFNGGFHEGHATNGYIILDEDSVEIIWAGQYYGGGYTNNKAESFALYDAL